MFWEPNTFCGPCQCVGFVKQTKKNQCMIFTAESKQAQGEETPVFSSSQTKKKRLSAINIFKLQFHIYLFILSECAETNGK